MRPSPERVDAVVLASGFNKVPLYEGYVPGYKALLPVGGRASIHYTLDALEAAPGVGRICVEGPRALLEPELAKRPARDRIELIDGGETFLDSLVLGLRHFASSPRVLFATADLPLVTPRAIDDFLAGCAARPARLCVSAVPKASFTGPYAAFTKPFNRYRDVSLCHGNLFLADPKLLENPELKEKINRFYAGRKNAVKTTLALGWQLAVVYMIGVEVLHALTLNQMAASASKRLGFEIAPVLVEHPGISLDIDEADDYELVRKLREVPCP